MPPENVHRLPAGEGPDGGGPGVGCGGRQARRDDPERQGTGEDQGGDRRRTPVGQYLPGVAASTPDAQMTGGVGRQAPCG
jgi:hypothetical protein